MRVTFVLAGKLAVQVLGQLIPAGLLVIVPDPAAGAATVNTYEVGGGGVLILEPPQPARSRVKRVDKHVHQNLFVDFKRRALQVANLG